MKFTDKLHKAINPCIKEIDKDYVLRRGDYIFFKDGSKVEVAGWAGNTVKEIWGEAPKCGYSESIIEVRKAKELQLE